MDDFTLNYGVEQLDSPPIVWPSWMRKIARPMRRNHSSEVVR